MTAQYQRPSGTPLVEMRDISIAFGGIKAVDHASVDLFPGEVVALLGHNGAGKSTLIKMLSGAYKRDHGDILINGDKVVIDNPRDAKGLGIETIYQTLGLADNVDAAANLFLGREILTKWGTLDDVAMEAEARKVMGRLNPNFRRFKEPVKALSGGQRQRIAIARAILRDAPILLLDEATSALDAESETLVQTALDGLMQNRTTLVIAHRLATVLKADRILVIDQGRIVEEGTHQSLTTKGGIYARLASLQFGVDRHNVVHMVR